MLRGRPFLSSLSVIQLPFQSSFVLHITKTTAIMDTLVSKYANSASSASFDNADNLGDNLAGWDAASQFALPAFDIPMVANVRVCFSRLRLSGAFCSFVDLSRHKKNKLITLCISLFSLSVTIARRLPACTHRRLCREPYQDSTRNHDSGFQVPGRNHCRCRFPCLRRILYWYGRSAFLSPSGVDSFTKDALSWIN